MFAAPRLVAPELRYLSAHDDALGGAAPPAPVSIEVVPYGLPAPPRAYVFAGAGWAYGVGCGVGPFFGVGVGVSRGVVFGAGAGVGAFCGVGFGSGLVVGNGTGHIPFGLNTRYVPARFGAFL